ncbi:hypothetical protein K402DRAFT_393137 [Aulographum hederae CBS 113979]|uniref:RING-CH-type domain-containing protein n=1 Tax=Aulographum hederae CBS 113979 TaxID=1176131 RepID=A0A6G1H1B1_9PEZI|nr:hypothetical protein K402DRAFT_393137 [Aulographum hederae CBS 113979]
MASLPQRPASNRQSSHQTSSHSEPSQSNLPRSDSEAFSTVSEDSQTLLLNSPSSKPTEAVQDASVPPQDPSQEQNVRVCWVCRLDETEDDQLSSEWRNPCPCALVAHESCLLDWIADMESPSSNSRFGVAAPKILCPQCKTEIKLERPRDLVVDGVRAIERASGNLVLPGAFFVGGATVWQGCVAHGIHTIFALFGPDDAYRLLRPIYQNFHPTAPLKDVLLHSLVNWRHHVGIGLITPILVLSRTNIADSFLPIMPILFFATSPTTDSINAAQWPPSATLSFALLPYLRGAYNAYYERVWGERERRWLKVIQPRGGEDNLPDPNNPADHNDDANILEINIEIEEDEDDEDDDFHLHLDHDHDHDHEHDHDIAHPLNAPPLDNPDQHNHIPRNPPQEPAHNHQPRAFHFETSTIATTILGALAFPSIAAVMGEILYLTLPSKLTRLPNPYARPSKLLQMKWGRSLIGGAMFVVLKDAVMLYVRWKMAKNHGERRVLDWRGEKGRGKGRR